MAPFDPNLLDALEVSVVDRIGGTAWRQVLHPTSATRSNLRGGRWNTIGIETLYCSLDPDTTAAEIEHLLASQSVPIKRQRLSYPIHLEISRVADIRPKPWGQQFSFSYDIDDVSECQLIGAAAAWLELGGLLVPSLRSDGDNLIIFFSNLAPDDYFTAGKPFDYPPGPSLADRVNIVQPI